MMAEYGRCSIKNSSDNLIEIDMYSPASSVHSLQRCRPAHARCIHMHGQQSEPTGRDPREINVRMHSIRSTMRADPQQLSSPQPKILVLSSTQQHQCQHGQRNPTKNSVQQVLISTARSGAVLPRHQWPVQGQRRSPMPEHVAQLSDIAATAGPMQAEAGTARL